MFKVLPDLPCVPTWVLDQLDITERPVNNITQLTGSGDWQKQNYDWIRFPTSNNTAGRKVFNPDTVEWMSNNIATNFNTKNAGWQYFDAQQVPHTDITREWVLLYNLEVGGDQVELVFYQEPGKQLVNERGAGFDEYNHLFEVMRVPSPPANTWFMFNSQVIHGIQNQQSTRVNLQLSFDHGVIPELCTVLNKTLS
jgi:hypothetical protein